MLALTGLLEFVLGGILKGHVAAFVEQQLKRLLVETFE